MTWVIETHKCGVQKAKALLSSGFHLNTDEMSLEKHKRYKNYSLCSLYLRAGHGKWNKTKPKATENGYWVCKADKGSLKLDQRLWICNKRGAVHIGYWVGGLYCWFYYCSRLKELIYPDMGSEDIKNVVWALNENTNVKGLFTSNYKTNFWLIAIRPHRQFYKNKTSTH